MDFSLSKEQQDLRKAAREFAKKEIAPIAKQCDTEEYMDMEVLEKARELGFVGAHLPAEYGGVGMGYLEKALITEEFWRIDPGLGQSILSVTFGSEIIMEHGSQEQREKYLTRMAGEAFIVAGAITEPNAGSDVTMVETTAVREGDEYVINGTKMFITNGTLADILILFCKTDPDEPNPHKRFSCIIVETDRKGYQANKLKDKMGIRASDTAEVSLRDIRVPVGNLIGQEGQGFRQILSLFNRQRTEICAQSTGLAQGALDLAIQHIKQREQFGKKLASFQALRFKIAEMATLVEASRSMYYRACWTLDSGNEDHALISMAKWYCAENAVTVANESLQMHGGYGFLNEYDIARFYRSAKICEIYEGTKEVEKIVIARALLGRE
ncbi:MAG: acyl-CoA dehydrogenase [Proteobacteria bacterium]|nr:acyl-CoA dehydrogenase [Pseudomonadota bacterium]